MRTIHVNARKTAKAMGLKLCPSCHGSGQVTYLAYGGGAYSTHQRPCGYCDCLGMTAVRS